jgi:pimeloyl-ACP methyl ester carboxylesterase
LGNRTIHDSRPDPRANPAVLAIHGLGGGAYFFHDLAERLRDDYRVVALDLPTSPRGFSMESWVAGLRPLASEPVVLLGHSMGTILALEAWAAWPDRIRGLIFVGGVPQVAPRIRARLSDRVRALEGAPDLAGWGPKVSPGVFSPSTFRDRPDVVAAFEQRFEEQTVDGYVQSCRILLGANAEAIVGTVDVPCLAITGEHDQYAPPDAVVEFLRKLPRQAALEVLPDCGHFAFLEQPDAFGAAVKSFLRTC